MIKHIKDIDICYEELGDKKGQPVILLHGWGQNIEMMKPIGNQLEDRFHVFIIDLPGFGYSEKPTGVWTIYDYAECIYEFLKECSIKNPILIGHSFGGKISLAYASRYDVKKLVVFGSPFRKEVEKLSLKTKLLKMIKQIPGIEPLANIAKKYIGSTDYKNASPLMRDILVQHVNLDITEDVKRIKCPTLIVWGTNDEQVKLEDAYVLEELIPDAGVVEYAGCTHYAYLENLAQTKKVLYSFFEEK